MSRISFWQMSGREFRYGISKKIMDYFAEINDQKKKAVVVVTHDPVVASYARRILFIKDGKIMKQMENHSKQQESIRVISDAMLDL